MTSRKADQDVDLSKSIEELEDSYWGEPEFASTLNIKTYAARRKALQDLTPGDIRRLLIQQVGVRYVVPLTIDLLRDDPMVEGLAYEGDILEFLMKIPRPFWLDHPGLTAEVEKIYAHFVILATFMDESWRECCLPAILESYDMFSGKRPSKEWHRPDEPH